MGEGSGISYVCDIHTKIHQIHKPEDSAQVAMFACLGYIVPEYYRWPGDLSPSLGLKFSALSAAANHV